MKKKMKSIDVKVVEIKDLRVRGVVTEYTERVWIDDKNHPEGGNYQNVQKCYDSPRVNVSFMATVDKDLEKGVYTDGTNTFSCNVPHLISLVSDDVESFEIPEKLTLVSSKFNG